MPAASGGHLFPETSSVPSTPHDDQRSDRARTERSGSADSFARRRHEAAAVHLRGRRCERTGSDARPLAAHRHPRLHRRDVRRRQRGDRRRPRHHGRPGGGGAAALEPTASGQVVAAPPGTTPGQPAACPEGYPPSETAPATPPARPPRRPRRPLPSSPPPRRSRPRRPPRPRRRRPRRRAASRSSRRTSSPATASLTVKRRLSVRPRRPNPAERQGRPRRRHRQGRRQGAGEGRQPAATPRPSTTRRSSSRPRSAALGARTSCSTASRSRPSCSRSTRPPACSTACAGRSSPRSTRSRPTTAATSTSPPPARSAGCSSCPATWEIYGVDANGDGAQGPLQPGRRDLRRRALPEGRGRRRRTCAARSSPTTTPTGTSTTSCRAQADRGLPAEVVASLSGLTLGRFPVAARATYAGRISTKALAPPARTPRSPSRATARAARCDLHRAGPPSSRSRTAASSASGHTKRLGKFIRLRDAYGNRYVYGHLASIATTHPVPRKRKTSARAVRHELGLDRKDQRPEHAATAGRRGSARRAVAHPAVSRRQARPAGAARPPDGRPGRLRRRPAAPGRRHLVRRLVRAALQAGSQGRRPQAAHEGLARHRRHDPRPRRPRLAAPRGRRAHRRPPRRAHGRRGRGRHPRPAPVVRDPAGRQPDAAHRPEADPRRLAPAEPTDVYRARRTRWPAPRAPRAA